MVRFNFGKWVACVVVLCCFTLWAEAHKDKKATVKHTVLGTSVKGHGKEMRADYSRIATRGKTWVVSLDGAEERRYYVSGDTLIGDWQGVKLYWDCQGMPVYQGALCESGFQTGLVPPGEQEPWLMYDFSMREQDSEWIYCPMAEDSYWSQIIFSGSEQHGGKDLFFVGGNSCVERTDTMDTGFVWIEGIGSVYGILSPCQGKHVDATLVACYDAEKCIFKDGVIVDELDSIGFLECKEVDDIATFKRLYNGTESKLTLVSDTVCCVRGDSIFLNDGTGTLILYRTGLDLHCGEVLKGTLIGRKEWVDGKPVLTATEFTSANTYSVVETVSRYAEPVGIGPTTVVTSVRRNVPVGLDGIRGHRRGVVIRNGRLEIDKLRK